MLADHIFQDVCSDNKKQQQTHNIVNKMHNSVRVSDTGQSG